MGSRRLLVRAVAPAGGILALAAVTLTSPAAAPALVRPSAARVDWCASHGPIPVRQLRAASSSGCSLVGRLVTDGRVGVAVPPAGLTVSGDGMTRQGDAPELTISNAGGRVRAVRHARPARHTRSGAPSGDAGGWVITPLPSSTSVGLAGPTDPSLAAYTGPTAACRDRTYHLEGGHRWVGRLRYSINLGRMPRRFDASTVVSQIRAANANMRTGRNTCGKPAAATPGSVYLGQTTRRPDIRAAGPTCTSPGNATNIVGFGDLPAGLLGWTCYWYDARGHMVGADMMIDNGKNLATRLPRGCTHVWDFEGTVTHEWGHAYGLAHTGSGHPKLTMQHELKPCSPYARTLGLGDWRGMNALYGHR
jgi:hypothetical protein